jgi:hypothetical protein
MQIECAKGFIPVLEKNVSSLSILTQFVV